AGEATGEPAARCPTTGDPAGPVPGRGHVAHLVVLLALLLVAEHVVGRRDLFESILRVLVPGVGVGVVLLGQLAVGLLDLGRGGVLRHAEDLVVVLLKPLATHVAVHGSSSRARRARRERSRDGSRCPAACIPDERPPRRAGRPHRRRSASTPRARWGRTPCPRPRSAPAPPPEGAPGARWGRGRPRRGPRASPARGAGAPRRPAAPATWSCACGSSRTPPGAAAGGRGTRRPASWRARARPARRSAWGRKDGGDERPPHPSRRGTGACRRRGPSARGPRELRGRARSRVGLDRDLGRLGLLDPGDLDREHPVREASVDLGRVHLRRQGHGAAERTVPALDPVVALLLDLGGDLAGAADRQRRVLDGYLDILGAHPRQLHGDDDLIVGLVDVHRRDPRGLTVSAERAADQTIEPIVEQPDIGQLVSPQHDAIPHRSPPSSTISPSTTSFSPSGSAPGAPPAAAAAVCCPSGVCWYIAWPIRWNVCFTASVPALIFSTSSPLRASFSSSLSFLSSSRSGSGTLSPHSSTERSIWYVSWSAWLRASAASRRVWSSAANFSASWTIRSMSSLDSADPPVIVIACSLPVAMSLADTLTMPLASMSKATSICGIPRGAGGRPVSMNLPSERTPGEKTVSASPCTR